MSQQNIYDNSTFFEGYKKIRENKGNANDLFETPALFSLLPDLQGKTILDLGCGVGGHCFEFVNRGAKKVVGIDISKKMLEVAEKAASCRSRSILFRISSTVCWLVLSSRPSISSMITVRMVWQLIFRFLIRSRIRPGVPTIS